MEWYGMLRRFGRITLGFVAAYYLANYTGAMDLIVSYIPAGWELYVAPIIGAVFNGFAKFLRDNGYSQEGFGKITKIL